MSQDDREPSNLLTPSRLRTFRDCPRRHDYEYLQGYRPLLTPEQLFFGSAYHDCLEGALLAVRALLGDEIGPIKWTVDLRGGVNDAFLCGVWGRIPDGLDPFVEAKLVACLLYVRARLAETDFWSTWKILSVEEPFVFPHINPETRRRSPLWLRAGKIDATLVNRHTKRLAVMEHKTTTEEIDAGSVYWQRLALDGQISQYVLAVESMNEGWTVDEVVYDVLKKPGIRPATATPMENRKYTIPKYRLCPECKKTKPPGVGQPHRVNVAAEGEPERIVECEWDPDNLGKRRVCTDPGGKLYAGLRDTDETPEEFQERCLQSLLDSGGNSYRIEVIPRTEGQIWEHLQDVWSISQAIREDRNNGWSVKNPEACHRFGTCPFWDVCTHTVSIDDPNRFIRLDNVHPELGEDFVKLVSKHTQE